MSNLHIATLGKVFLVISAGVMLCMLEALPTQFLGQAHAVIGRPMTPGSYAGVARRTARRSVYAASAATAAVSAQAAAQPQPADAQRPPAAAPEPKAGMQLPAGTTLPSLPPGCESATVHGKSYFRCGASWMKPAMAGSEVVYKVVADPQ